MVLKSLAKSDHLGTAVAIFQYMLSSALGCTESFSLIPMTRRLPKGTLT